MADIFRVLSRSTSLGFNTHAATVQNTPPLSTSAAIKRDRVSSDNILDVTGELDFFRAISHSKNELNVGSNKRIREDDNHKSISEPVSQENDSAVSEGKPQDEAIEEVKPVTDEDRRQLMRQHKFKIVLLNSSEFRVEEVRKLKKRRKGTFKEKEALSEKKVQLKSTHLLTSFDHLRLPPYNLSKRLFSNLLAQGYKAPTPVQIASLPLLLLNYTYQHVGNVIQPIAAQNSATDTANPNIITCAPTGSGKTLAFLLPLLSWLLCKRTAIRKLSGNSEGLKAIIMAPTKELVGQICNEGLKLSLNTGVRVFALKKSSFPKEKHNEDDNSNGNAGEESGVDKPRLEPTFKCDIVVSTPRMLLHALEKGVVDCYTVERLILDEADVLLEKDPASGFGKETLEIWQRLKSGPKSRDIRIWMWSATISSGVEELAEKMMFSESDSLSLIENAKGNTSLKKKRKETEKSSTLPCPEQPPLLRLIVGLKNISLPTITHKLIYAAAEPGKLLALRQLFASCFPPPALIFMQTIPRAQALYNEIRYDLPLYAPGKIAVLHSDLSDNARSNVMNRFRAGQIWILVTTDLLSRGVDFRGVNVVVNYDIPTSAASYVHRAGRTGRAGRSGGVVYTYYTKEDIKYVKTIASIIAESEKLQDREKAASTEWLLSYLPKVTKEEKKKLKKFGPEQRRAGLLRPADNRKDGKRGLGGKIATQPGWEIQRRNKKRVAIEASKRRRQLGIGGRRKNEHIQDGVGVNNGEWQEAEEFNDDPGWVARG